METPIRLILAACVLAGGCERLGIGARARHGEPGKPHAAALRIDPLPVQQARAYPETVTGIFASLADFEDTPSGERGHEQVRHFAIEPDATDGRLKFVVNVTRTGVGAMEVNLPVGCELAFRLPHVHDFTGYKLLSMALYSRALRDDLQVTVVTEGASWRSHRTLVRPGWNNVLFDIQRLAAVRGFDINQVTSIRLGFPDAAGSVWFNVDDVMVIDNARAIHPTPPAVALRKSGLNYTLELPGREAPLEVRQNADGLWRLGQAQPQVRLAPPGEDLSQNGEHLDLMGDRRVGRVDLLEHNELRVRLANTWYFPTRAGEWASLAVRRIRWEHTFYADGRWVIFGELNNAGGREIGSAGVFLSEQAAWAGGEMADHHVLRDFAGEVGRWRCLVPPAGPRGKDLAEGYLHPGRVQPAIAAEGRFAPGDEDRDGFDESQGCYFLAARAGHCRFTLVPPAKGLWAPAFRIEGPWSGAVHVASEGRAIRDVARCADGCVLFLLPGHVDRPEAVEVTGSVGSASDE